MLGLSSIGYAMGQVIFAFSTGIPGVVIARLVSGFFSGGYCVSSLAYVTMGATSEERPRQMSYYAAIYTFSNAIGYLFGGAIGSISIKAVFIAQIVIQALAGVAVLVLLKDKPKQIENAQHTSEKLSFASIQKVFSTTILIYFACVFLTSFATTGQQEAFNYYIMTNLHVTSMQNGVIKAIIGFGGLILNFTLSIWISKKFHPKNSITILLFFCGITLIPAVLYAQRATLFILATLIFSAFGALYVPVQQELLMDNSGGLSAGMISGIFNSVKFAGMVIGPLVVGFSYQLNAIFPFVICAVLFLGCTVLSFIYQLLTNSGESGQDAV